MKINKVLITGGAGFLGFNLAHSLLSKGVDTVVCDNLSRRGAELNLAELKHHHQAALKFYQVEISDVPAVIVKEKPDLIYHFAAQVAVTTSVASPVSDFRINAEGSFLVAKTAHDHGIPVIYSSTNKVYGINVNKVPLEEFDTRYDFAGGLRKKGIGENFSIDAHHHTPYGCSKLVGEIYVREYGGVANRFSCMYGPNQYGIVDQGWLSYFIARKLAGKPLTVFGDGKQVRDALHIKDVVKLLELQGERLFDDSKPSIKGEVFTIGGGYLNTISLLELCKKLDIKPEFGDWRPADQKVFYCDISKAKEVLGWQPQVSIEDGLKELLDWTKKRLAHFPHS
ncbi:MAG: GDP-mannose 4,6-dehydratase [Patescibacteria group bacterium]